MWSQSIPPFVEDVPLGIVEPTSALLFWSTQAGASLLKHYNRVLFVISNAYPAYMLLKSLDLRRRFKYLIQRFNAAQMVFTLSCVILNKTSN